MTDQPEAPWGTVPITMFGTITPTIDPTAQPLTGYYNPHEMRTLRSLKASGDLATIRFIHDLKVHLDASLHHESITAATAARRAKEPPP